MINFNLFNDNDNNPTYSLLKEKAGEAYWQPSPNDGTRITFKISDKNFPQSNFHCGLHHLAPGSKIPSHHHDHAMEMIFIHKGQVEATVNDDLHLLSAGDCLCLPPNSKHELINTSDVEAILLWVISPADGLCDYFRHIGKAVKDINEPAPPPFSAERMPNAQTKKD